jgi:hypothetical protein
MHTYSGVFRYTESISRKAALFLGNTYPPTLVIIYQRYSRPRTNGPKPAKVWATSGIYTMYIGSIVVIVLLITALWCFWEDRVLSLLSLLFLEMYKLRAPSLSLSWCSPGEVYLLGSYESQLLVYSLPGKQWPVGHACQSSQWMVGAKPSLSTSEALQGWGAGWWEYIVQLFLWLSHTPAVPSVNLELFYEPFLLKSV